MPRGGKHVPSTVSSYRDSPTPQNNTLLQELYHLIHRVQVFVCVCEGVLVFAFKVIFVLPDYLYQQSFHPRSIGITLMSL